jgi:hypothetical protein
MPFEGINLTDSKYIPQYAGLPLEAMERVGDDLQTRHYDNIAKLRQLELMGLQQAAATPSGGDKNYINSQVGGIQGALAEIAKTGGENATGKIGALATRFLGDEGMIRMKRNADQYRAQQEKIATLGKSGIFNQKLTDEYLSKGSINPDGTYNDFMSTAQERLNYMKKQDELLEPFRADVTQGNLLGDMNTTLNALGANFSGDLGSMPTYLKTTAVKKLTMDKMGKWLDNGGWEGYKSSAEYEQQKNVLDMSDEDIKNELVARAEAKVFEEVDKQWMNNKAFDFKAAQGAADGLAAGQGEQLPNTKPPVISMVDVPYDRFLTKTRQGGTGEGDPKTYSKEGQLPMGANASIGVPGQPYNGPSNALTDTDWTKLSEAAELGKEIFGSGSDESFTGLTKASDPATVAKAVAYAQQYETVANQRAQFRQKDTTFTTRSGEEGRANFEDLTTDLKNNLKSRVFYDEATGKTIPVTNKEGTEYSKQFIEAVGSPDNLTVTGFLNPQNYLAAESGIEDLSDAMTVTVRDKENPTKTRELFVTQKAYDQQNAPRRAFNKSINRLYVGFNSKPGKEAVVDIGGVKVKGRELYGNQLKTYLDEDQQKAAAGMQKPMIVDVPGLGTLLVDGPFELMNYIEQNKANVQWENQ